MEEPTQTRQALCFGTFGLALTTPVAEVSAVSRSLTIGTVLGVFLAVSLAGLAHEPAAIGGDPKVRIIVRVYNYAGVSYPELAAAEAEATEVFRKAGVQMEWLDCSFSPAGNPTEPACHQALGSRKLILGILPFSRRPASATDIYGLALVAPDSGGGVDAAVFYDASRSRILGGLAAHECGHLLLGSSHSRAGIMRPEWNQKDLERAARGELGFTPRQSEFIRAALMARGGR